MNAAGVGGQADVVGGAGTEAGVELLRRGRAWDLVIRLAVEEEQYPLRGLLHSVGVPGGEIGLRGDPQITSLASCLTEVDGRLRDAGGAAAAIGLDDVDLAPVGPAVGPQPDSGEQALIRLRETCSGLQGPVNEGEQTLSGDEGLVDVADGLLLVEAVLKTLERRDALAPQEVPRAVTDAVGVPSEHAPVVACARLGLGAVVPPAGRGEIGSLGELLVKNKGSEVVGLLVCDGGGVGEQAGRGQTGPGAEAGDDRTSSRECHVFPCLRRSH